MSEPDLISDKARLRQYHAESTRLGGVHWGVTDRTLREWMSDTNKRPVPEWVTSHIIGEAEYDRGFLAGPTAPDF